MLGLSDVPRAGLRELEMSIDQSTIDVYAELTGDRNPLHIDPDFAVTTAMGGVIAHGTLSLNLLWEMIGQNLGPARHGLHLNVRFNAPVRPGDHVVAGGHAEDNGQGAYTVWVKNQRGETVIAGTLRVDAAMGR